MSPLHNILASLTLGLVLLVVMLYIEAQACQDHFYATAGLGKNAMLFSESDWEDQGSIGSLLGLGYRMQVVDNFYATFSYTHYSHPFVGPPFDDQYEDSLDAFYASAEYRWY